MQKKLYFCAVVYHRAIIYMSNLQNKSDILKEVAVMLHNKNMYPAVAHSAYYSCYQLLKHIWLYRMGKL
jgi:hypothetical protein